VGDAGEFVEVEALAHRHPARVDSEDLAPPALVGDADHDLAVEAAGAAQRLVDGVGAIGRGDDDDVGALLQPVHQGQKLGDEALFRLAGDLGALGRDRIDLVDEDDRRRSAGRLLKHLPQALFALAVARTHDLGAVDDEELRVALVGDGLGEAGLAGARRAVEQHALGRLHPEADEQLGVTQRQFDHLAQGANRFLHAADVVIVDHRAAIARLLELGAQLDLGVLVDMDDALGAGRGDGEPDLGQGIGRRTQQLAHVCGHVLDGLLPGCGDHVAGDQRTAEEVALQRLCGALETHLALGGREDDAGRGAGFAAGDLDMLARARLGIGALEPVEAHHVERVVFGVGRHGDRRGRALPAHLQHVAFGDAEPLERRARDARDPGPGFLLPRGRDLEPCGAGGNVGFSVGHGVSLLSRMRDR